MRIVYGVVGDGHMPKWLECVQIKKYWVKFVSL